MEEIVQQTASAMVSRGVPFSGVLFAGLMIKDGKVLCSALGTLPPTLLHIAMHCMWLAAQEQRQ